MLIGPQRLRGPRRRAATVAAVAVSSVVLLGAAAFTIDVGILYRAREESQIAADAAALAGAWELMDHDALSGLPNTSDEAIAARATAAEYAARNPVMNSAPQIDTNSDVQLGYLNDIYDPNEAINFTTPPVLNTVLVRVHGPVQLTFASVLGFETSNVGAQAAATFKEGVVGFGTPSDGTVGLLPLALHVDVWEELLDGTWPSTDNWSHDPDQNTVSSGQDFIPEINLYPGGGNGQLPPGNFGTVDIGSPDNSTAVISRQILDGITEADLAWHGGEFVLGEDGTLVVEGDTGLSAGIKDELASIIGQPRTILLFNNVTGNGNNSRFTVVGFAGVVLVEVKMTGAMNKKKVLIQPANVVEPAAIAGPGSASSDFVYHPVILVR